MKEVHGCPYKETNKGRCIHRFGPFDCMIKIAEDCPHFIEWLKRERKSLTLLPKATGEYLR